MIKEGDTFGQKMVLPELNMIEQIREQVNKMDLKSSLVAPFYVAIEDPRHRRPCSQGRRPGGEGINRDGVGTLAVPGHWRDIRSGSLGNRPPRAARAHFLPRHRSPSRGQLGLSLPSRAAQGSRAPEITVVADR